MRSRESVRGTAWTLLASLALISCSESQNRENAEPAAATGSATGSVVVRWNEATVEALRRSGLPPTAMARGLSIVHTCIYDAWAAYQDVAAPTRTGTRQPTAEHTVESQRTAISFAAYRAAVDVFPGGQADLFDPLLRDLGHAPEERSSEGPARVGDAACGAVLREAHRDGANQLGDADDGRPGVPYSDWTGYRPAIAPLDLTTKGSARSAEDLNRWQPLTYVDATGQTVTPAFLTPQWARVKPFALRSPSALRPRGPVRAESKEFTRQARDLVRLSENLTEHQKVIARFWAAGPRNEYAPGQWSVFAGHVAHRDSHGVEAAGIERDVKMFFVLSNAIADATIACWDAKVHFDSVRPITAIRALFAGQRIRAWAGPGQGTATIDGGEWLPYHPATAPSPPFAEYPAGHSVLGAAGAEALLLFTGSDRLDYSALVLAGTSGFEPGVPAADVRLTWPTFTAAAQEEGMSRRYAGVHFARADVDGQELGRRVARVVWAKAQALFAGRT